MKALVVCGFQPPQDCPESLAFFERRFLLHNFLIFSLSRAFVWVKKQMWEDNAWISLHFLCTHFCSASAKNEYSWCIFLILHAQAWQTLSDLFYGECNFKPTCLHQFTLMKPFCLDAWNKFSVAIAWVDSPYSTFNEHPHSRQKSLIRGRRGFLPCSFVFFGVTFTSDVMSPCWSACCCESVHFPVTSKT